MSKGLKAHLLIIDPQNSFMDINNATLPVSGANDDMNRVADIIKRVGNRFEDIHVTMDSHHPVDVAHPIWWMDQDGNSPPPFTIISSNDISSSVWQARNLSVRNRSHQYVLDLEAGGKKLLCIWPPHCLIGSWGHNFHDNLGDALREWEERQFATVNVVTKGSNPFTEHYGAFMAEVPDPNDPSTGLNTERLQMFAEADIVYVSGEASSHCVMESVNQIADNIGDAHLSKFHLLTDCMSPVGAVPNGPDFPAITEAWLKNMESRGMKLCTSGDVFA
jgi:nicotinamidase/pyrazinamidase